MIRKLFSSQDAGVPAAVPEAEKGLIEARARNTLAADNLRDTLQNLLEENDRLNFRPVYMAGSRTERP